MENNTETKKCKKCGEELPISEFYKDKRCLDGHISKCKSCISKERKEYYCKNRDKIKEKSLQYYKEHREECMRYNIEWQSKNWDKIKDKNTQKMQRRRSTQGSYTIEQWSECLLFFGNACAYSGEKFGEDVPEKITVEHITPISKGGTNFIWNVIPVKYKYNSSRGNTLIYEWYKQQPFYSEERLDLIRQWKQYARNKWGV